MMQMKLDSCISSPFGQISSESRAKVKAARKCTATILLIRYNYIQLQPSNHINNLIIKNTYLTK